MRSRCRPTLSNAFRDREVEKTYRALVLGEVLEELEIDAPLAARKGSKDRMLVSYLENSQEAHTTVTPLNTIAVDCAPGCVTEVELQPHTGRKHQLRVHLSHMKHPIVGDQLYGDKRMGRWFRERMGCDWMWLHASSVSFMHPSADENDDMLEFSSPLPKHWKEALVRLKLAERGSS